MPRVVSRLALAAGWLLTLTGTVGAQSIQGLLVDADTGHPISGALLVLTDDEGESVNKTMSDAAGAYSLEAPAPGSYRIRTDRIGFTSSTTDWIEIAVGEAIAFRVETDVEPIELTSLVVDANWEGDRCRRSREASAATFALWDEARKALENSVWADSALRYRFSGVRRTQFIDQDGEPIPIRPLEETPESGLEDGAPLDSLITVTSSGYELFRSLPAEDLRKIGYVVRVTPALDRKYLLTYSLSGPDTSSDSTSTTVSTRTVTEWTAFFGPDARVLLSDVFHETHCLRIEENDDMPGMIGLRFEPVDSKAVDIDGVLWLDRASAELRSVEFRYVGDLPTANRSHCVSVHAATRAQCENAARDARLWPSTGRIDFDRLASGPFIVRSWWIQVPGVKTGNPLVDSRGVWTREGGLVTRVLPPASN